MKNYLIIALLVIGIFSPEIIKLARIKHMKKLGDKYEDDKLVRL
ncbi:hypothetical protein [Staphylococcus warneri]|nr:hypothetical protein [Staphylococcus warneri]